MNAIISQLRLLLKSSKQLQDIFYDYKEQERLEMRKIQQSFYLRRVILQYPYLKGGEWKSFAFLSAGAFFMLATINGLLLGYSTLALILSTLLTLIVNGIFVYVYKPYKLEQWYVSGGLYYGVVIGFQGGLTLAVASIVFFEEGSPLLLHTMILWLMYLLFSYIFGGIVPFMYRTLERRAFQSDSLKEKLFALEKEKRAAIQALKQGLEREKNRLEEATRKVEENTLIPAQYKTPRALEMMISYLENQEVQTLEEAIQRFDQDAKDALRTMRILKSK